MTKTVLFSPSIGDVVFPMTPTSIDGMTIGANTPAAGTFTNVTANNILINQISLSSSTTLTASQAGSYVFWNSQNSGTITLPNSQNFPVFGSGIFYIQNNSSTSNISVATISTDHNNLPGGNGTLGGSITLSPLQGVIAVANPDPSGGHWQSLNLNLIQSLQVLNAASVGTLSVTTVKTFTANGTTPVTVNDPTVTANSQILITLKTPGGTVGPKPYLTSITPGTGFTVVAAAGDTSVYNYLRIS
jgi:hypothetical protein